MLSGIILLSSLITPTRKKIKNYSLTNLSISVKAHYPPSFLASIKEGIVDCLTFNGIKRDWRLLLYCIVIFLKHIIKNHNSN